MSVRRPFLAIGLSAFLLLPGCSGTSVLTLEVGDCLQQADLATGEVRNVPTVECATLHDTEVYAAHELPGEDHPGRQEVSGLADTACSTAFTDFVGIPHADSELTYASLSPTEESWETSQDRTVLCLIVSPEPVTGSLAGAAR